MYASADVGADAVMHLESTLVVRKSGGTEPNFQVVF